MSRIIHAAEASFATVPPLNHVPHTKRGVFFRTESGAGVGEIGKATRPGKYRVKRVAAGLRGYEEIPSRLASYRPGHAPLRTVFRWARGILLATHPQKVSTCTRRVGAAPAGVC
ncbi:MAG: hypothetical protein LC644_05440, partial [Pseudonocardia sp.]|nr:hypothetical protein [Pseudonocardia sp.]